MLRRYDLRTALDDARPRRHQHRRTPDDAVAGREEDLLPAVASSTGSSRWTCAPARSCASSALPNLIPDTPREQYLLDSAHHGIAMNPRAPGSASPAPCPTTRRWSTPTTSSAARCSSGRTASPTGSPRAGTAGTATSPGAAPTRSPRSPTAPAGSSRPCRVGDHPQRIRNGFVRRALVPGLPDHTPADDVQSVPVPIGDSRQVRRQPGQALLDVGRGPAKLRRTNRRPAAVSKSMPGADRDAGARRAGRWAEGHRVVGEVADVGVDVERAVRRGEPVDARAAAGRRAAGDGWRRSARRGRRSSAYDASSKAASAGALGEDGRADREVAGEHVDRRGAAARAPASSRSASRSSRSTWRTRRRRRPRGEVSQAERDSGALAVERGVLDAVVDLVGDQLDAVLLAPARPARRAPPGSSMVPGRVGRAGARPGRLTVGRAPRASLDRRLEPGLRTGRQLDDLAAERGQHVAVAGVARAAPSPPGRRPRTPRGTPAGSRRWTRS